MYVPYWGTKFTSKDKYWFLNWCCAWRFISVQIPYRMSTLELMELKMQLQGYLEKGYTWPSVIQWEALVLCMKKERWYSQAMYWLRVSKQSNCEEQYPFPEINDLFNQMRGENVFLNRLKCSFNKWWIKEECIHKTPLKTRYGQY